MRWTSVVFPQTRRPIEHATQDRPGFEQLAQGCIRAEEMPPSRVFVRKSPEAFVRQAVSFNAALPRPSPLPSGQQRVSIDGGERRTDFPVRSVHLGHGETP